MMVVFGNLYGIEVIMFDIRSTFVSDKFFKGYTTYRENTNMNRLIKTVVIAVLCIVAMQVAVADNKDIIIMLRRTDMVLQWLWQRITG